MSRIPLLRSSWLVPRGAVGIGVLGLLALAGPISAAVALAPIDDRAGDRRAAAIVGDTFEAELAAQVELVDPVVLRDAQRRLRIRSIDDASVGDLEELGRTAGADRIVTVSMHRASRDRVPRITLSGRAYSTETGELLWVGFESSSGLDSRKLLGLGVIEELDELGKRASRRLVEDLLAALSRSPGERAGTAPRRARADAALGRVAVLPLGAVIEQGGTSVAETATAAVRASLFRHGVEQVAPNRIADLLRHLRSRRWGGVEAAVRHELQTAFQVRHLLTGSVERFDSVGTQQEPEPRVTIALRALEAATGRIVWTGSRERSGWDGQGPFHLGRVYARSDLTERLVEDLIRDLLHHSASLASSNPPAVAAEAGRSTG